MFRRPLICQEESPGTLGVRCSLMTCTVCGCFRCSPVCRERMWPTPLVYSSCLAYLFLSWFSLSTNNNLVIKKLITLTGIIQEEESGCLQDLFCNCRSSNLRVMTVTPMAQRSFIIFVDFTSMRLLPVLLLPISKAEEQVSCDCCKISPPVHCHSVSTDDNCNQSSCVLHTSYPWLKPNNSGATAAAAAADTQTHTHTLVVLDQSSSLRRSVCLLQRKPIPIVFSRQSRSTQRIPPRDGGGLVNRRSQDNSAAATSAFGRLPSLLLLANNRRWQGGGCRDGLIDGGGSGWTDSLFGWRAERCLGHVAD